MRDDFALPSVTAQNSARPNLIGLDVASELHMTFSMDLGDISARSNGCLDPVSIPHLWVGTGKQGKKAFY